MRDRRTVKPNLILTGLMGCGKTTVGRLLAAELGWEFVDTDQLIEEATGHSIPELFREKGEPFFRLVEKEAIRGLAGKNHAVVATGGGAVLDGENRRLLQSLGLVVYLKTAPEVLGGRVQRSTDRPLLAGQDAVGVLAKLLREREKYYCEADEVVRTDGRTPRQVAAEIINLARQWGVGTG
ncbi:MAG TPA: shikimate kinase [Firmicutes bacterium]|uniref:Shikimate kinase n=1 Tax=Capillibacterium thermochitinicola TaxID=2699427 RepID=A0A8J6HYI4_9FIRM|nr:shikimate kinase [Capillibacterium thermochitinicola]MBA2132013.1 shikimate kinase [Capillibacterium thermochitinicola]HHW12276.1 shikimate kinase [Bacillota bacterium]